MAIKIETVPLPQEPPAPVVDYEKKLYIQKIAEFLCDDNSEVRELIRARLEPKDKGDILKYAEDNGVSLI